MTKIRVTDIDTTGASEGDHIVVDDSGNADWKAPVIPEALIPVIAGGSEPPTFLYTPNGELVFLKVPMP